MTPVIAMHVSFTKLRKHKSHIFQYSSIPELQQLSQLIKFSVLHSFGNMSPYSIQHIFPCGYIPELHQLSLLDSLYYALLEQKLTDPICVFFHIATFINANWIHVILHVTIAYFSIKQLP